MFDLDVWLISENASEILLVKPQSLKDIRKFSKHTCNISRFYFSDNYFTVLGTSFEN